MAFDLGAIRSGIETRLKTIAGLQVHRTVPGDIIAPAAIVAPAETFIDYHLAHNKGLAEADWRVILAVSKTMDAAGQDLLDDYLSAGTGQTKSVIDALEADKTLGGAVAHLHVQVGRSYGDVRWNETSVYFGADLIVACRVNRQ